ncbi:CHASE domain-containing protein [Sulfurimonas microaerophilic]|uniref:CHASE domain-containing protein n=1 Tax=Sulfurimonas microaerophilic TaxID=3058392 RepID=UPI0027144ED1|nr:CHASE domain-containing protein [Sulfurimonas sp. hsl 1-7]
MFQCIKFLFKLLNRYITYSGLSVFLVFLLSLALSVVIWLYSKSYYDTLAEERFERRIAESLEHLQDKIYLYENILHSGIGFFQGSNKVSAKEWHDFIDALAIKKRNYGMQGIGYAVMLKPDEVLPIEKKMQKDGFQSFSLKPKGQRDLYSAILYLEPLDKRNQEAIGYDMFSEPTRRAAMEIARDTGLPAISKKVTLVQEIDTDVQAGMLMYLPLYKKGSKPGNIEERRKLLKGFVYSPFRMNDLISTLDMHRSALEIKIYDSDDISDEHLLFDSFTPYAEKAQHSVVKKFQVNNLTWNVYFVSTKEFDDATTSPYPLVITLVGLIANFLLLLIILALFKSLKNLKAQTQRTKEQTSYMLHQSRMAQMGEMISMIAHQWRQPLSSISTIAGTMSIDVAMDNYEKKFFAEQLESIDNLSQHLSTTIDDFRDFFKDKKKKQLATAYQVVDETLQIIGSSFESKEIEVIYDSEENISIYTYVNEIKQVILNILKNAEDALSEKKDKNFKIWISWHMFEDNVIISIEDNAGGIPEKIIKNIFEPYFSTKQDNNGTGLGLYMSKTIVEEHCNGKLYVTNTQRGAKFSIEFPSGLDEIDN